MILLILYKYFFLRYNFTFLFRCVANIELTLCVLFLDIKPFIEINLKKKQAMPLTNIVVFYQQKDFQYWFSRFRDYPILIQKYYLFIKLTYIYYLLKLYLPQYIYDFINFLRYKFAFCYVVQQTSTLDFRFYFQTQQTEICI